MNTDNKFKAMRFNYSNHTQRDKLLTKLQELGYSILYIKYGSSSLVTNPLGEIYSYSLWDSFIVGNTRIDPTPIEEFLNQEKRKELLDPFPHGAKFRVNSYEENRILQNHLFGLGYIWMRTDSKTVIDNTSIVGLFAHRYGDGLGHDKVLGMYHIGSGGTPGMTYFNNHPLPEFTFSQHMDFKEVKKVVIPPPIETIEIDGKKYSKDAVKERLQNLPEIK